MPREPAPAPIGRLRVKAGERPAHARRYLADCGLPKERTYFEGVMCKICTLLFSSSSFFPENISDVSFHFCKQLLLRLQTIVAFFNAGHFFIDLLILFVYI